MQVRLHHVRVERERAFRAVERLRMAAKLAVHAREVRPAERVARINLQRLHQTLRRLGRPVQRAEQQAGEIVPNLEIRRVQRQRAAIACLRIIQSSQRRQRDAGIIPRLGVRGIFGGPLPRERQRLRPPAFFTKRARVGDFGFQARCHLANCSNFARPRQFLFGRRRHIQLRFNHGSLTTGAAETEHNPFIDFIKFSLSNSHVFKNVIF